MLATLIVIALIIDLLVFIDADRYFLSLVFLVAQVVTICFFFPPAMAFLSGFSWQSIAITYLSLGLVIALAKWLLFNLEIGRKIRKVASTFSLERYPASEGENKYRLFLRYFHKQVEVSEVFKSSYYYRPDAILEVTTKEGMDFYLTPRASVHKGRIAAWVLQWPFVVIEVLAKNLIVEFSRWASTVVEAILLGVSKRIISKSTSPENW